MAVKNILITGGAGKIGYDLVLRLLDSRYSITVLDLKSKASIKKLNKIKNKIKIIYGDIEDKNLITDLVKKNDIVIDYAGIMPPLANIDEKISYRTNYIGTKNIVDAINEVNPDCLLIYMSFISIYGTSVNARRLTTLSESTHPDDYYSVNLIRSEDYIKNNLKKFTILRMPIVLTRKNYYLNHLALNKTVDFISIKDLNMNILKILNSKKIIGITYNISGFKANSSTFLMKRYNYSGKLGIHVRSLYYGEYDDFNEIQNISNVKCQNMMSYLKELKATTNPLLRIIRKILYFPTYFIIKKKTKR